MIPARLLALIAGACLAPAAMAEIPPRQAAALYQRICSVCHGDKGDGQSRARASLSTTPRDFTAEDARKELPRELMIAIVREGKYNTAMVGRKTRLSEEQMEGVVDFIRTAFMPPEPGTPLARGYAIYRQSCASCHGDRGQGGLAGHAAAKVPAISHARPDGQPSRQRMIEAVSEERHLKVTARGGVRLSASDVEAVVDYVRTAFIDSLADHTASRAQ
ncbi:MAG TPA: c-type cytochrome [Burkholderiales bacterium]